MFLDGETEKGATVTVSDGGRMNNLDIYEDHVIVRNDNGPNMSNSLMGPAHNGDGDIPYSFSDPHVTIANGFTLLVTEGEAFQQDGNVTVGSTAAANLKIQGDWDAASTLAVKGDITGSGNLNGGSASVDIDGEITISTYTATSGTTSVGGDWNVENFTHSSGTVVFDGTGTVTGDSFYTFHVNAPGFTRSVSGDLTVENQLILSAGTFDSGSGNHSVAGIWNDTGITFQPSSGTIILTSASPSIVQGGANNFYNLEITNGATLGSVIDVNGDLTITSGTLNSGSNTIEVAAGWSNSGSFSAGTGTVIFDDASTTSVITGQTVFNNFTCTTPGKALQFEANKKQTVNGIFTITGSNTSFITLGSTATGVNWEIDAVSESVQYASVQDSSAYTIISADDSVDGGNNTNWTFDSSNYWIWEGSADTDWSNPANWSKGSVPAGAGSRAIIATAAQRMPVLTADISGGSAPDYLTIESGSTVDTAGYNLTPLTQLQNFGTIRRKAGDVVTSDPDSGAVVYYGEVLSS